MRVALIIFALVHLPVFIYGQVNSFFWDTTYSNNWFPEMHITHDSNSLFIIGQKGVGSIRNDFVIAKSSNKGKNRILNEYLIQRGVVYQRDILIWNNKLLTIESGLDSGAVSTHLSFFDKQSLYIDSSHTIVDSTDSLGLKYFDSFVAFPLSDSNLILAGFIREENNRAAAICISPEHEIKWITHYKPNPNYSYFLFDIDSLSNGQIVISGFSESNQTESPFFLFLNKDNGNVTKSKSWQNAGYNDGRGGLAITPDDEIILGASEVKYYQALESYRYPKIACFDTNGFKLWETKIDQSNPRAGYYTDQIDYMSDSTILLKCAFLSDQGELQSSLTKFSLNGDSLWTKYISHPENSSFSYTGINEFLELSNKDIVYCGYYSSSNKGDQSFVARVNKHGCFYGADWCYDTPIIPNYGDVGISNEKDKRAKIEIWPNPANDHISLDNQTNNRVQLSIIDMSGKKLYHELMEKGLTEVQVSFLSPGVYILEMSSSNKLIDQQKLIVK
jgi:hypothetical protein